jgi:hypothetical protein
MKRRPLHKLNVSLLINKFPTLYEDQVHNHAFKRPALNLEEDEWSYGLIKLNAIKTYGECKYKYMHS